MELLHRLLTPEGVLFVYLDQEENHYMKVLLDKLRGPYNFLRQVANERSGYLVSVKAEHSWSSVAVGACLARGWGF
jgi:hypothetical protein